MNNNFGAVIIAAGLSTRMGHPKALLKFDDSQLFIDKIIQEYSDSGCKKIVVVINQEDYWKEFLKTSTFNQNVLFIENHHLEFERFYSVKLGLQALKEIDFCFIQNIDNPFVDSETLKMLNENKVETGYIVPTFETRGGHPILLSKNVAQDIIEETENSSNLKMVLQKHKRVNVEVKQEILVNIDTQEEYIKYFPEEFLRKI